jgi:hypothetical protein
MDSGRETCTRRSFFFRGSAALGTGIAAGAGASAVLSQVSPPEREAIREVHLTYTRLIEQREFEAAAELFDEHAEVSLSGETASGRPEIEKLLTSGYRHQTVAALHDAYRPNAHQQQDFITISKDHQRATATWHVDVALGLPLQGEGTLVQMARLQGQMAERRWVSGRLEAQYVKIDRRWKMTNLSYRDS